LIADEFAGSQGDARISVGHVGWNVRYDAADNLGLSTDRKGTLTWMENSAAQKFKILTISMCKP